MPSSESEARDLYRAKPGDFVRERDALVTRLRKAGRREAAADIQRLRKPTPALWVVNQLADAASDDLADFARAIKQLQAAQLGTRPGLAMARGEQRQALDRLVKRARALLTTAGLAATPATLGRVSATLLGAAVDPRGRDLLRRGQLTEERATPGFEAFALRSIPRGRGRTPEDQAVSDGGQTSAKASRARLDRKARAEALQAHRTAEREARAAARRAAQLGRQAVRRQRRVDKTAERVERLKDELRQAEQRLAEERQAAQQAARFAARAHPGGGDRSP